MEHIPQKISVRLGKDSPCIGCKQCHIRRGRKEMLQGKQRMACDFETDGKTRNQLRRYFMGLMRCRLPELDGDKGVEKDDLAEYRKAERLVYLCLHRLRE